MSQPLISICIPAYKRINFLRRLLNSIAIQTFRNFEVIVSDDSKTNEVSDLIEEVKCKFHIIYQKNLVALGTPENWNKAISLASGSWIKLMHDDDWFVDENSLQAWANAAINRPETFIYAKYNNYFFSSGKTEVMHSQLFLRYLMHRNPFVLLSRNIIVPPSVIMHKNNKDLKYDCLIKWLVDIEFYIRRLKSEKFYYINKQLVNVGMGDEQVTAYCHANPHIEIPEFFYFLEKTGLIQLKNILVYDTWWRLFRNYNIRNNLGLSAYYSGSCPEAINRIIEDIAKCPKVILKIGLFSKFIMAISFFKNRKMLK